MDDEADDAYASARADARARASANACACAIADACACAFAFADANAGANAYGKGNRMKVEFTVHFDKGYIAHPYWPEQEKLINVQKESGMRRVRSAEKASQALANWLAAHDMTQDEYQELERLAARPFYTDGSAEIIIPEHQVYGLFAQSCHLSTSSIRIARAEQVRSVLLTTAWRTGKTASDGIWERFVVVTGGTGGKLSNQRALRSNPYIAGFDARGMLSFSADILDAVKVKKFLEFAGREVGIGASRKLGWGRFEVTGWKVG